MSGVKTFSGKTDTIIEAKDGGKLTLNATKISGDVDVTSNGKGSVVQLPRLTAFNGTDSYSPSFIWALNQGTVKA
ncbi:hypothetical protein, partial [Lyngbya sp. CCY1209]|uniref:hypothetical protein n=1 Tax=Lyngbya sp. CCY1209 TaxID=2886103 RepID=UPI002D2038E1